MAEEILRVLYSAETLSARIAALGEEITRDYQGKRPLFLGVLKGSFVFMADLVRAVELPCAIDFLAVSSYGKGTNTTGAVKITKDLSRDIEGMDVIIVEDILDSGLTLRYLTDYLTTRRPASISIATLLDKPERRQVEIHPDYLGFSVPDEFVVGFGLDYAEQYRNLPYIGILNPSVYQTP